MRLSLFWDLALLGSTALFLMQVINMTVHTGRIQRFFRLRWSEADDHAGWVLPNHGQPVLTILKLNTLDVLKELRRKHEGWQQHDHTPK